MDTSIFKISNQNEKSKFNHHRDSTTVDLNICKYCDENQYQRSECSAKDEICNFCSNKGHFEKCCLFKKFKVTNKPTSSKSDNDKDKVKINSNSNKQISSIFVHKINQSENSNRKFVDIEINSKPIRLQIDTGADLSIISKKNADALQLLLKPTFLTPKVASGSTLNLIGEIECNLKLNDKIRNTSIFVSQNENLNIFGNDLFNEFDLFNTPINDFCVKILKMGRRLHHKKKR